MCACEDLMFVVLGAVYIVSDGQVAATLVCVHMYGQCHSHTPAMRQANSMYVKGGHLVRNNIQHPTATRADL